MWRNPQYFARSRLSSQIKFNFIRWSSRNYLVVQTIVQRMAQSGENKETIMCFEWGMKNCLLLDWAVLLKIVADRMRSLTPTLLTAVAESTKKDNSTIASKRTNNLKQCLFPPQRMVVSLAFTLCINCNLLDKNRTNIVPSLSPCCCFSYCLLSSFFLFLFR